MDLYLGLKMAHKVKCDVLTISTGSSFLTTSPYNETDMET